MFIAIKKNILKIVIFNIMLIKNCYCKCNCCNKENKENKKDEIIRIESQEDFDYTIGLPTTEDCLYEYIETIFPDSANIDKILIDKIYKDMYEYSINDNNDFKEIFYIEEIKVDNKQCYLLLCIVIRKTLNDNENKLDIVYKFKYSNLTYKFDKFKEKESEMIKEYKIKAIKNCKEEINKYYNDKKKDKN